MSPDMEPADLYVVVRRAVEDAIWAVVGSMLTLVVAFALFVVGLQLAIAGVGSVTTPSTYLVPLAGVVLMPLGVLLALRELRVWPFSRP